MRTERRHIAWLVSVVALCAGTAAQADGCTAAAFAKDAAATYVSCETLLKSDLTPAQKAEAYKIRGRVLQRLGRLDEAISDYEAAIRLSPDDPSLYVRRGWATYDKAELQVALKYAAYAMSLNANEDDAYDLAGAVMMRLGDIDRAKTMFDKAVRLQPHNLWARLHRYELFNAQKKFPEALAELDEIIALPVAITRAESMKFHAHFVEEHVSFRTGAALHRVMMLNSMARIADAAEALDKVVAEDPRALTFALRASNNRYNRAAPEAEILADVEKSIALDPKHWYPRDIRARVHVDAKRYEAAEAEFSAAIKLAPNRGILRWGHVMALRYLGRIEEATAEAIAAIDIDPEYFVTYKTPTLASRGYLQTVSEDKRMQALRDAVQACMLDERCY